MGHDWIIDVLADLRSFARQNDLPHLSAQLDEAIIVATAEVSAVRGYAASWSAEERLHDGSISKD